ncbi:octanoyltransferase mitochondrial [Echinococcus multilocularis]|uniref:lipoyl(octanoyl) transferase n=1 Tax=Echinococcus multilocularis TaxID=6211 RepID=A0A068XYA6_ECHMU|nr:octanoyltransferase mitochondrial [Echinococcus multilocularis]
MPVIVRSWFLGRVDYSRALKLQESLVDLNCRSENKCPAHTILMLEHDPVYTVGIRSKSCTQEQQKELQSYGAQFIRTNRGGLITYHGPGQLVAYPIVNLRGSEMAGRGLKWFIDALEQSGYEVCREFRGDSFYKGSVLFPDITGATGVWLNKHNKIMSIGLHRTRSMIHHGVGLNCTMDPLKWFDKIAPCGLSDCKMTSLESVIGTRIAPAEVAPKLSERLFVNLFSHQVNLECTFSDFLADNSLSWDEVVRLILEDAGFRARAIQVAWGKPPQLW